jgi:Proto-chlorophyllide reductase 57 kD subunit
VTPQGETSSEAAATLAWTPEAEQRLARVPAGFMRNMTRTRVENLAREKGCTTVTLETAEEAIGMARQLMQETIGTYMQSRAGTSVPSESATT